MYELKQIYKLKDYLKCYTVLFQFQLFYWIVSFKSPEGGFKTY